MPKTKRVVLRGPGLNNMIKTGNYRPLQKSKELTENPGINVKLKTKLPTVKT